MFQYWIERIVRRTTIDNTLNTMGNGARSRIADTGISARKNRRNLANVAQALLALSGEAVRREFYATDHERNVDGLATVRGDRLYDPIRMIDHLAAISPPMPVGDSAVHALDERIKALLDRMNAHCLLFVQDITDSGTRTIADAQEYLDQKIADEVASINNERAINWPGGRIYDDEPYSSPYNRALILGSTFRNVFIITFRGVGEYPSVRIRRSDGTYSPARILDSDELRSSTAYRNLSQAAKNALHYRVSSDTGRDSSLKATIDTWNLIYPPGNRRKALQRIKYYDCDIAWTESLNPSNMLGPGPGTAFYIFIEGHGPVLMNAESE